MQEMKRLSIIWGIIMVLIFAGLTAFGFFYTKQNKEYKKWEEKLSEAAKKYVEIDYLYDKAEQKEGVKISLEDLKKEKLIEDIKIKGNTCDAYAKVTYNGAVYNYKGYVKCDKYQTKGY